MLFLSLIANYWCGKCDLNYYCKNQTIQHALASVNFINVQAVAEKGD